MKLHSSFTLYILRATDTHKHAYCQLTAPVVSITKHCFMFRLTSAAILRNQTIFRHTQRCGLSTVNGDIYKTSINVTILTVMLKLLQYKESTKSLHPNNLETGMSSEFHCKAIHANTTCITIKDCIVTLGATYYCFLIRSSNTSTAQCLAITPLRIRLSALLLPPDDGYGR